MKTVIQEIKEEIRRLQEIRENDLITITTKQTEAAADLEQATAIMIEAAEQLDSEKYEAGKRQERAAKTALEMLNTRYEQLSKREYISESDSDAIIDKILAYETDREAVFIKDITAPIKKLTAIYNAYMDDVNDAEETLRTWQADIHKNYRTRGRTMFLNAETGERTDRSSEPIAVRIMPYTGGNAAASLGKYLNDVNDLIDEGNK